MQRSLTKAFQVSIIIPLFLFSGAFVQAFAGSYAVVGNVKNAVSRSDAQQQVKRLFLRQRAAWSNGLAGRAFDRAATTPEHRAFRRVVLDMSKDRLSNYWLSLKQRTGETPPRTIASTRMLIRLVSKYDGSFGVVEEKYTKVLPAGVRVLFTFSD